MTDMRPMVVPPDDDEDESPIIVGQEAAAFVSAAAAGSDVSLASGSKRAIPAALCEKFDLLKKRKLSGDQANQVAEETHAMIRAEVQHMQNAVAELESYLAQAAANPNNLDGHNNNNNNGALNQEDGRRPAVVPDVIVPRKFPALPKVVLVETPGRRDADEEGNGGIH